MLELSKMKLYCDVGGSHVIHSEIYMINNYVFGHSEPDVR